MQFPSSGIFRSAAEKREDRFRRHQEIQVLFGAKTPSPVAREAEPADRFRRSGRSLRTAEHPFVTITVAARPRLGIQMSPCHSR